MADKAISALPTATVLNSSDLFVLSQSNTAKNTTWQTIIGYLATALAGHGGISSIAKTGTSGLADTYTITYADSTTFNFVVTNGKGISSIAKTGTAGLVDTYTISYNDGTTGTFTVDNGNGITSIVKTPAVPPSITDSYRVNYADGTYYDFTVDNGTTITSIEDWFGASTSNSVEPASYSTTPPTLSANDKYLWHYQIYTFNDDSTIETTHAVEGAYGDTGDASYVWIRYSAVEPTRDSDMVLSPNKWIGIYSGTASPAPSSYTDYTWYQYKGDKGDTGATGDYIEQIVSYGTSTAAASEPSTWYNDPSSISYLAGNFIWQKTEYTLHNAQTVQAVDKHIIGYIGQNGSGSGTVNQITFNGTAYADDGTGNVSINVDAEDIGAIENPSTKSNGQVLTYDSGAGKWVAANPSTGNVNTVNNVGVTAGTTNIQLTGENIPVSTLDNTPVANAIPALPLSIANGGTGATDAPTAITNLGLPLTVDSANSILELASSWMLDDGAGTVMPVTNDVLADALAMPAYTVKAFRGGGANYTGTLPDGNTNWAYGSFIVLKRNSTYHQVIAVNNNSELAVNSCNNGSTWIGWVTAFTLKAVTKTATVNFAAGTIGTRGFQTSWTAAQIGGNPVLAQITEIVASNEYHPMAFISGTTVYLNAYRATSAAVSSSANRVVNVTIYYR